MIDIFTNLVFDVTHMESSVEYDKWPRCKNQRVVNPAEIIILINTKMALTTFERVAIHLLLSNKRVRNPVLATRLPTLLWGRASPRA